MNTSFSIIPQQELTPVPGKAPQWWGRRAQAHSTSSWCTHTAHSASSGHPGCTESTPATSPPWEILHRNPRCFHLHLTAGGELCAWQMLALQICSSGKHKGRGRGRAKSTLAGKEWCPWCCIILLPTWRYTKTQLTIRLFWITAPWTWFMEELCGMIDPRAPCWA